MYSWGYTFDEDGIRIWPFKKIYLKWDEVVNVIGYNYTPSEPNAYSVLIKFIRQGKLNSLKIKYCYSFKYFISLAGFSATLKLIIENLPPETTCLFTKELAKFSKLERENGLDNKELGQKALNFWLQRQPRKAYELCKSILTSDERSITALKVSGFYYYYDKQDACQAKNIFEKMLALELYDPLVMETHIYMKMALNENQDLDLLMNKFRSLLNYPDYRLEFSLLDYYANLTDGIEKAQKQLEYMKALAPAFRDPTHTELLDKFSREIEANL